MADWTEKLDRPLRRIYADSRPQPSDRDSMESARSSDQDDSYADSYGDSYFVMVQHMGSLAELESLGLRHTTDLGECLASGEISLAELERLASSPTVVRIDHGTEDEPFLESSVPEIKADKVWTLNRTSGVFSGTGETGKGVVIGIIDSGIDITHPDFLATTTPKKTTRIKRIWDPGLVPIAGESSPDLSLLAPGRAATYGVEYDENAINAELQGGKKIRHADCNGHGTHVASIAAGGGSADGLPFKNVGVAPKADLVIVKIFSLAKANPPSFSQRFIDAVHYIENVAKTKLGNPAVVINYSGGSSTGPHDGLASNELFLTNHFRGATGRAFVTSSGNSANDRAHALIKIPTGGKVEVPFELFDRRTLKTDFKRCSHNSNTRSLYIDVWYPDVAGVTVKLKLETESGFRATAVSRGGSDLTGTFDGGKTFELSHGKQAAARPAEPAATPPIAASTINRSNINLKVGAKGDSHTVGSGYALEISGPKDTELHVWCSQGSRQGFKIGATLPSGVTVLDEKNLIGPPGGARHVLTVAAYDDVSGKITNFSSRGGLVDYSAVGNLAVKPDLSAPGKTINAANSSTTENLSSRGSKCRPYTFKSGTSMSSPHVAGTVALMLQKKKTLSLKDIITVLTTDKKGARATAPSEAFGAGKVDAKGAVDNV